MPLPDIAEHQPPPANREHSDSDRYRDLPGKTVKRIRTHSAAPLPEVRDGENI